MLAFAFTKHSIPKHVSWEILFVCSKAQPQICQKIPAVFPVSTRGWEDDNTNDHEQWPKTSLMAIGEYSS